MADSRLHTPVFGVLVALSLSVTRIQAQTETTTSGPEDDGVSSIQWYIWLILAAAAVVALILIAVILCFLLRLCARSCRRSFSQPEAKAKKRKLQQQQQQQHLLVSEKSAHLLVEDEDYCSKNINWEISRAKIRLIRQLGIGEFGAVYDAEVRLGKNMKSRALVKVFQKGTPQDLVLFWQEMQEVMKLQHPRVARLFGVVSRSPYFAVFELPVNGDLKTFLISIKSSGTKFTVPQLIGMAAELASGMVYLENMEYVHKDVAARNCVVTQNLGVKIADYGVGRYLFRSEYAVQADGSLMAIRWMAPESLAENLFSLFSDAWSFGVLIWEIMTVGQFPYTELTDAEVVHRVCYEYQRLLQPLECPENIYKLMLRCWHKDPTERPSMLWLQQQLETGILPQSRETSPIPSPAPLDSSFDAIAAHDAMQY